MGYRGVTQFQKLVSWDTTGGSCITFHDLVAMEVPQPLLP